MILNKKIVATIEARMTSSRLPGKGMMEAGGKPLLQILIERLQRSQYIDALVMATTTNRQDDPIADLCSRLNVACFRGSEHNVLDRVCGALHSVNADIAVEITGDCPLIDPILVDDVIEKFAQLYPKHRYVTNVERVPIGFDAQVFMAEDLYAINESNPDDFDKEHVSYSFYREESQGKYAPIRIAPLDVKLERPELWITLDYREDYCVIKCIYEDLSVVNQDFSAQDVIAWLDQHPQERDALIHLHNLPRS
jgi:spore coat polysaccharide biosynthesis protein SpsF